jgi:hypothetical protein
MAATELDTCPFSGREPSHCKLDDPAITGAHLAWHTAHHLLAELGGLRTGLAAQRARLQGVSLDDDDRPWSDGRSTDARFSRWVREHVPDTRIRMDGGDLVTLTGGELYDLVSQAAERFYWHGADDASGRPS